MARPTNRCADPISYQSLVKADLRILVDAWTPRKEADQIVSLFESRRNLLLRATMPPTGMSDRLMRYQAMFERRLSSAMGELLELQRRRTSP